MVVPNPHEPIDSGQLHFKVSLADFTPTRPLTRVIWTVLFGGLGVAGLIWAISLAGAGQPVALLLGVALVFILMGATSLLSVFVRTPA